MKTETPQKNILNKDEFLNAFLNMYKKKHGIVNQLYQFANKGFRNFNFRQNGEIPRAASKYGFMELYTNYYSSGTTDFLSYIINTAFNAEVSFIAPTKLKFTQNNSLGANLPIAKNKTYRFMLGYYETIKGKGISQRINPTLIYQKDFTTGDNALDLREEIQSEVVIPKGAILIYAYSLVSGDPNHYYQIKTDLIFNTILEDV